MTAAAHANKPRRSATSPLRAILHWLLLRGLRPPRLKHDPPWANDQIDGLRMSAIQVRGGRGQRLAAWLALPRAACAERPAAVVVAVHGWGANASTLSPIVDPLVREGIAVMLFDAASHGDSSSETFSSLPRFAEDLAAVLDTLREVPAIDCRRIALLGHSVGAAAVLLHSARHGGVRAIASLSAFANPKEVMERWLQQHRIPRRWIGTAILELVQDVIGERFDHIAPEHHLTDIDCPVLLVHGAQDQTVPLSDARRLQSRLRHGELLIVDGDHDLRVSLQPHTGHLVRFFSAHLADCAG